MTGRSGGRIRLVEVLGAALALVLAQGALAQPSPAVSAFPRAVSPFVITADADVARVRYEPVTEQAWLIQQRVMVFRQDVEIRTQQLLTTTAEPQGPRAWHFEGHGAVLAADGFVDGYGKTVPAADLATDLTLEYVTDHEGTIQELDIEGGGAQMDVAQRALRAVQAPRQVPKRLVPGQEWSHNEHLDLDLGTPDVAEDAARGLVGMRLVADVNASYTFRGWSMVGDRRTLLLESTVELGGLVFATFDDGHVFTQAMAVDARGFLHMDEHANALYQVVDLRLVMTDDQDVNARIHIKQVLGDADLVGHPGVCAQGYLLNEDGSCGRWRSPYRTRIPRSGETARVLSDRHLAVYGGLTPSQMDAHHEALLPVYERYEAATTDEEREAVWSDFPDLPPQLGVELMDLRTGEVETLKLPRVSHHYDLFAVDEASFAVVGSPTGRVEPSPHYVALYDIGSGGWTEMPGLPAASPGCAGRTLDGGGLHVACHVEEDVVAWTLEGETWQERPVDEQLLAVFGQDPPPAETPADWVPEELPWRIRYSTPLTAAGARWFLSREDDGTSSLISVLDEPDCTATRRGVEQMVLLDGAIVPLAEVCAAQPDEATSTEASDTLADAPPRLGEQPMVPLEFEQGVLFAAPHPFEEHGLQWWPRGDDRLHPVALADEPMPSAALEEIRLGVVLPVREHPTHVVRTALLPLEDSVLMVTETEYDGWDYTRYSDAVSWEFDPATATLFYRSYLDVGLVDPALGAHGQWIALQEFDDDLGAHFAWAEALRRWVRLPNTVQRDVAHYDVQQLENIRSSDDAAWLSWMAKPSRQWQAPFFTWEVLERRGFCLAGDGV